MLETDSDQVDKKLWKLIKVKSKPTDKTPRQKIIE